MGSYPADTCFHELNLKKCGGRPGGGRGREWEALPAAPLQCPREEALAMSAERLEDPAELVREVSCDRAASGCRGQSAALG